MTKRTLGAVVKEAREEYRMTQRDLAAAVGIKASHVAYIENGQRRPSIALINRLSKTLGLDAKEVLVLAHPEAKQIIDGAQPSTKKATVRGLDSSQTRRCSSVTPSPKMSSRFSNRSRCSKRSPIPGISSSS